MKQGSIYILSNPSIKDNLIKIGKTIKGAKKRSKQLSSSTSIPQEFKVEGEFYFYDIDKSEMEIHDQLKEFRYNDRREFFNCAIEIAVEVIKNIQILDYKRTIKLLERQLKQENLSSKKKWEKFFDYMGWDIIDVSNSKNIPGDFYLKLKLLEPDDSVQNSSATIYFIDGLEISEEFLLNDANILELVKQHNGNTKLFLISNGLLTDSELLSNYYFAVECNKKFESWNKIKFIKSNRGYGLLDDEFFWSCMIRGIALNREDLAVDDNILASWQKDLT